jgi:pimeloyl-ACP methyl ester carboxylesterase
VEAVVGDEPVHFVTHSLGGIIMRALLADSPSWKTGRILMLAPPHGGSEIVDWSTRHPWIRRLLGPAGRSLGTVGFPRDLPPLPKDAEVAVIMGNRCSIPLFRRLLEEANDGIVSASRGKIPGLLGFTVIDADHTFIQTHPEAVRLCVEFLKTGHWSA